MLITSVQTHLPGKQILEGQELDLPPIVLGSSGTDPSKKTVLVYGKSIQEIISGHYDVQPALLSDGLVMSLSSHP